MLRAISVAALAVALSASSASAMDWGDFYAKVFGGVTAPNTLDFYGNPYDVDPGSMFGGAVGVVVHDGVSLELDVTHSAADLTGFTPGTVYSTGTTIMANVVLNLPVGDMLDLYGGAGLGGVYGTYKESGSPEVHGWAAAGQVFGGVSVRASENISVFGEVRHQAAFSDVPLVPLVVPPDSMQFARTAVLFGLKVSN
jgi:hypothetical protein